MAGGKQSVRMLLRQNRGVSSVEIDKTNIRGFERYAKKYGIHYNEGRSVLDYALNPEDFKFVNGFVSLPQKPGLGVEVNKALVEEEGQTPHSWKNPVWRHEDGSVAEW